MEVHPNLKHHSLLRQVMEIYCLFFDKNNNKIIYCYKMKESRVADIHKRSVLLAKNISQVIQFSFDEIFPKKGCSLLVISENSPLFCQQSVGFNELAESIVYAIQIRGLDFTRQSDFKTFDNTFFELMLSIMQYYNSISKEIPNDAIKWIVDITELNLNVDSISE